MNILDVAHLEVQGQNLIIVPLARSFGTSSYADQVRQMREIQFRATQAGLKGTVVPVWDDGGYMAFIAPTPWHPYFQSINLLFVLENLNRRLTW